jgi:hypothetical protein
MSETVIVAIISFIGTCFGTVGGIVASSKLTNFRLSELEDKVKKHNNIIERTYALEGRMTEAEHDIRDLKGAR